ncbi:DRC10 protein, partial [Piaya cayana]|nr:DRC10 protein [Piaya cayana]
MGDPEMATTTLKLMKMLEPRQLKPDCVEKERIINVLDETLEKLEMSSMIPHICASLDRYASMLGPELTEKLMEYQKLSKEMENMHSSLEEGDTVRAQEQQASLRSLEEQVKRSVRDVLRLLPDNPLLCYAMKHGGWERGEAAQEFVNAFREFRNLMVESLCTSPEEEEEKNRLLDDILLRIKKNTETITALEEELAAAIQTRDEKIRKKDSVIEDLKTSMRDLMKDHEADIQRIKEEGRKRQEAEVQASQARCATKEKEIVELRAQLKALVLEHRASEEALKKAEYEELNTAYNEEKAQLSLLMERHALLYQEYSWIEEERRMCQEKNRAATLIQAWWRGYLVRSRFKPKKKKKGKGK